MSRPARRLSRSDFERLVREYHAAVWHAARRAVRDSALAEDAAQDVFIAVLEGRFVPDPGEAEGRSLRWFAARRALELGRSDRRRREREERHGMERPQTESSTIDADERAQLLRHVEALPDELCAPLRLRYEEGMTWDAVGAALAIAPSSAHERVQRALERLRAALRGAGLPALALDFEDRLGDLPVPGTPLGLAPRLLALGVPAAGHLPVAPLVVGAVLLVGAAVGLRLHFGGDAPRHATPELALAPAVPAPADSRSEPSPPGGSPDRNEVRASSEVVAAPPSSASARTATIEGRLLDPRADPLEGIHIHAVPAGQKGGALLDDPGSLSRADGTYRIEVEPSEGLLEILAGEDTLGRPLATSPSFRLEPGRVTRVADLLVDFPGASQPRGDWELDIVVADPDGRPVPAAIARIEDPARARWSSSETFGRTDEAGRVFLSGGRIGPRTLAIDAPAGGFAPWSAPIELTAGRLQQRVVLARGLEILGRVTDLEGRPLADPARSEAPQGFGSALQVLVDAVDGSDGPSAEIAADGSFRVSGLAAGPWRLRIFAPGRSPVRLEVPAGTRGLEVALKSLDDERDVGRHDAELHGRLVDETTGMGVVAGSGAVEVDPLWELPAGAAPSAAEFERDILPWVLAERPVQREMSGDPPPDTDRFHAVGLEARACALVARVAGYGVRVVGPLVLGEREVRSGIELRLARPVPIAGLVRDTDGKLLAGAYVVLVGEGPYSERQLVEEDQRVAQSGRSWIGVRTETDGAFSFASLSPGMRVRLAVLHEGRVPSTSDWIEAGRGAVELRAGRAR
ncbi:MAG: sigma-70 family RNA polymerase sigma factor [Planctomycetota bacterium]|nr:sigma-70 family RNA polymerase sigma factor [Planctomycetota bacterium]